MAVNPSNEGLKLSNCTIRKVAPILDVNTLKSDYLFGITIEDEAGNPLSDPTYQRYIDNAVSSLEHALDVSISPKYDEVEYRDHHLNDYADWGYWALNNYPVINVTSIQLVYFRDNDGNDQEIQDIPHSWIRLQRHDGIIRLIPNATFAGSLQVGATGSFYPHLLYKSMVPHSWKITYDHGFEDGKVPVLVNQAIGLMAAIQALVTGGGLVIGAGIASESLSIDGISQTVNTTQSAENSAFSAQIKEYQTLLVGRNAQEAQNSIMATLKKYYKGQTMNII